MAFLNGTMDMNIMVTGGLIGFTDLANYCMLRATINLKGTRETSFGTRRKGMESITMIMGTSIKVIGLMTVRMIQMHNVVSQMAEKGLRPIKMASLLNGIQIDH